jgi:hypothetical protein
MFKDIQIGSNSTHTITRMQFPVQLVATHIIHRAQGFILDHLGFDPNGVYKHGFTYTTFFRIKNKENLYLFKPLQIKNFQIDPSVAIKIHRYDDKS